MVISDFLELVVRHGFTKACTIQKISREEMKEMTIQVAKAYADINSFSTKQQIVYSYIALKLKQNNL